LVGGSISSYVDDWRFDKMEWELTQMEWEHLMKLIELKREKPEEYKKLLKDIAEIV